MLSISAGALAAGALLICSPANAQCGGFAQAEIVNEVNPGMPYVQGQEVDIQVAFGPSGLIVGQSFRVDRVQVRLDCDKLQFCSDPCVDAGELLTFVPGSFSSTCANLVVHSVSGNIVELRPSPPGSLLLGPGAQCVFTFSVLVQNTGSEPNITGAVQMDGFCLPQNIAGGGCGTYIIPVINPAINIVKTADASPICADDDVVYTYTVTNPGDVALFNIVVTDDNGTPADPNDDFQPTFTGGDANNNAILETTEVWTYTATRTLTVTTTNTATVQGSFVTALATLTVDDLDGETVVVNPRPVCTIVPTPLQCATQYCVQIDTCSPFTVSWVGPNGFMSDQPCITLGENSAPGQYCATVVDCNGCTTVVPCCFNFTPPALNLQCTSAIACEGDSGNVCVTITGDHPPFAVQWFDAAMQPVGAPCNVPQSGGQCCVTVTAEGAYTAVVTDDFGCVRQCVAEFDTFGNRIVQTANQSVCQNSPNPQLCATVSGGIAPYTVTWRNAANQVVATCPAVAEGGQCCFTPTDTAPGVYTYTAHAVDASPVPGGCSGEAPATLTIHPQPSCFINSSRQKICEGQTATMCAVVSGGTPPYTYLWNTGSTFHCLIDVDEPGTYSVVVTDSLNCSTTCQFTLQPHEVQAEIVCQPLSGQIQLCANVIVGRPPFTYRWSVANTNPCILVDPQAPCTTYLVTVTDDNGCTDTAMIELEPGAGGQCTCPGGPPVCNGDISLDGAVNVNDLLAVINAWGACPQPCPPCPADCAGADCIVNVNDLLVVINNWGPCD